MKFLFLKFKKNDVPLLSSLRSRLFDTDKFWFLSLSLFFIIFIITAVIGFKLFYGIYFENYEKAQITETSDDLINITRLKSSIQKRADFITASTTLPRDPSL